MVGRAGFHNEKSSLFDELAFQIGMVAMRTMMIATQPGPKDPPTKDGGPIMGFVPERVAAISVAASDAQGTRIASGVPVTLPEAETGTWPGASPTPSR